MSRLILALVVFAGFASDVSAQCGQQRVRRQPVRNAIAAVREAIQELRPANHPRIFPRLAAAPAVHSSGVVVSGCASGQCVNGTCAVPAAPKLNPIIPLKK